MCGLKERTIQRKLITVADLTLQMAVERACAAELTEKETTALHGGSVEEARKGTAMFPECFRCGKVNHSSDTCFFRNSKCHRCQKVGHIVKKCPEKEQKPESGKKKWMPKLKFGNHLWCQKVSPVPVWSTIYFADRPQTSNLHSWSETWNFSPCSLSPTAMVHSIGNLHLRY